MSQHDMTIANDSGAAVRADINLALAALASLSSGGSAPATTFAGMLWIDTANALIKQRNQANSAWVTIGVLDATNWGLAALAGATFTGTLAMQALLDLSHASAGRIKFPATQVASADVNTLDDYEEGAGATAWTPVIEGTSTAGSGTYTSQIGHYTKIGRLVFFSADIAWSAHTGTGNMRIAGLPFTIGQSGNPPIDIWSSNITYSNQLKALLGSSGTTIDLYTQSTGAALALLPIDTAGEIGIRGWYHV
jgi:hypothetical protein